MRRRSPVLRVARLLATLAAWGLIGLVAMALAGRAWPAFDSFNILLPYAVAALALGVLAGFGASRATRLAALVAAVAGGLPILVLAWSAPPADRGGPALRLLQHNLRLVNPARDLAERVAGYDVVTLQESQSARPAITALPAPWTATVCTADPIRHTALLTPHPVAQSGCLDGLAAWARIETPAGPLSVVSVHLPWPWPAHGGAQGLRVDRLAREIAALPAPILLAGDFNQMPWSAAVARLADAAGGSVARGLRATYVKKDGLVRFPIDHVIVPPGWTTRLETGALRGSDHRSVLGEVAPPARG